MPKKSDIPLEKVTLNLYKGEMDILRQIHAPLSAADVVRELIHAHIRQVETVADQKKSGVDLPQLDLFKEEPPNV